MLKQAPINDDIEEEEAASPRGLTQGASHLLRDLVLLTELQAQLLWADLRDAVRRAVRPLVVCLAGVALALAMIPVALAAVAATIVAATNMSAAAALGITLAGSAAISGGLIYTGWRRLRQRADLFARSRSEWLTNLEWFKETLQYSRRQGSDRAPRRATPK